MTKDYPQIAGTPARSNHETACTTCAKLRCRIRLKFHRQDFNMSSQALQNALGVISGLLLAAGTPALGRLLLTLLGRLAASALGCRLLGGLAAGTPALRGGLLGATLLGCHADKLFLQETTEQDRFPELSPQMELIKHFRKNTPPPAQMQPKTQFPMPTDAEPWVTKIRNFQEILRERTNPTNPNGPDQIRWNTNYETPLNHGMNQYVTTQRKLHQRSQLRLVNSQ